MRMAPGQGHLCHIDTFLVYFCTDFQNSNSYVFLMTFSLLLYENLKIFHCFKKITDIPNPVGGTPGLSCERNTAR